MKMPLSEIIDRYTITMLKSERTEENVSEELKAYKQEIESKLYSERFDEIEIFIERLYKVNGQMWDTEGDIRSGVDLPLDEVGRLALKCRDINRIRNGIKGEVVDAFAEGFKELKVNYTKVDYGRS
ncbi:hypothetical protein OAP06_03015 [Gammaproteobacteria bacterium]|nr:hypothetical protein [Gammaproteobacteria bacterium]